MNIVLFTAFVVVPIAEISVLIEVGERIGTFSTIMAIFLTAAAGTALLRYQGMTTLLKVQKNMAKGIPPVAELFDGACLVLAGVLLLTPGFLTDALGFSLFFPPFRAFLRRLILIKMGFYGSEMPDGDGFSDDKREPDVIDVDFKDLD